MEQYTPVPKKVESLDVSHQMVETYRRVLEEVSEVHMKELFSGEVLRAGEGEALLQRFVPVEEISFHAAYQGDNRWGHLLPQPDHTIEIFVQTIETSLRGALLNHIYEQHSALLVIYEHAPTQELYEELETLRLRHLHLSDPESQDEQLAALRKVALLKTIVHEELHALTDDQLVAASGDEGERNNFVAKTGLRQVHFRLQDTGPSAQFETHYRYGGINEAVTELLAHRLCAAYVTQFPFEGAGSQEALRLMDQFGASYRQERWVVEQLIVVIAALADVPKATVDGAFVRAYIHREDVLDSEELRSLLAHSTVLPPQQVESLLLGLQLTLQADQFQIDSDIYRIFDTVIQHMPPHKQRAVRDGFGELLDKYVPSPLAADEN